MPNYFEYCCILLCSSMRLHEIMLSCKKGTGNVNLIASTTWETLHTRTCKHQNTVVVTKAKVRGSGSVVLLL